MQKILYVVPDVKVKVAQSCLTLCDPMDYIQSMESSRPEYRSRYLSLLQEIFSTQGSNTGLPNCRQILYQLSLRGSPVVADIFIKIDHEVEYSFHF